MVVYSPETVPLNRLLLDPNNFRFESPVESPRIAETRFAEASVQAAVLERIKSDGVAELKLSISENGFVPVERIVVRALDDDLDGRMVVIEGNRRTAALKFLEQDHRGGVDLKEEVNSIFDAVPVLVATGASEDDLLAIMGIRHVGGPKEWGGYQSALLVFKLLKEFSLTAREAASRLGLTVNEVNRRHRAFSVLSQMMDDEEYGVAVSSEMYPIFHEAIGQPVVREWLGWSPAENLFTDENNRSLLYSWLMGDGAPPKIQSFSEVRELKLILENEDALVALKDDDQSFSDALAIVRSDAKAARWRPNAKAALQSLDEMGSDVIESLEADDLDILTSLMKRSNWIVKANSVSNSFDVDEED